MPTIDNIDINKLKPYKKNARKHSEFQIGLIKKSFEKFGVVEPIVVDKTNNILAGHGRVEAAKEMKMKTTPSIRIDTMSAKDKRAYILASNRLAELSGWDNEMLATELTDLKSIGIDIGNIGWSDFEFKNIMKKFDFVTKDESVSNGFKDLKGFELKHICPKCGYEFD